MGCTSPRRAHSPVSSYPVEWTCVWHEVPAGAVRTALSQLFRRGTTTMNSFMHWQGGASRGYTRGEGVPQRFLPVPGIIVACAGHFVDAMRTSDGASCIFPPPAAFLPMKVL